MGFRDNLHTAFASTVTRPGATPSWADLIATHIGPTHSTQAVGDEDGFAGRLSSWRFGTLRFVLSTVRGASVRGIQPLERSTANLRDVWLCLCLDGSFEIDADRSSTVIDPDRMAIMICGRPHVVTFSRDCDVLWIRAPRRHFGTIRGNEPVIVLDTAAGAGRLCFQLLQGLQQQAESLDEHDAGRIVESTLGLVATAIRQIDRCEYLPERSTYLRLDDLKRFIDANLHDDSFGLESAATLLGRNPRTLNKLFEAEGDSFMHWTWNRRLERAFARLTDPGCGDSITETALSCGFKNMSHFSRAFRNRYGFPPSRLVRSSRPTARN